MPLYIVASFHIIKKTDSNFQVVVVVVVVVFFFFSIKNTQHMSMSFIIYCIIYCCIVASFQIIEGPGQDIQNRILLFLQSKFKTWRAAILGRMAL